MAETQTGHEQSNVKDVLLVLLGLVPGAGMSFTGGSHWLQFLAAWLVSIGVVLFVLRHELSRLKARTPKPMSLTIFIIAGAVIGGGLGVGVWARMPAPTASSPQTGATPSSPVRTQPMYSSRQVLKWGAPPVVMQLDLNLDNEAILTFTNPEPLGCTLALRAGPRISQDRVEPGDETQPFRTDVPNAVRSAWMMRTNGYYTFALNGTATHDIQVGQRTFRVTLSDIDRKQQPPSFEYVFLITER